MAFTITKTANYKHRINFDNAYDSMAVKVCKYKDWNNGSPDTDNLIVNISGYVGNYTINLSALTHRQDVYVVSIIATAGAVDTTFNFMLYDLTDLFTCYPTLMNEIFISSVDAGCAPCDHDQKEIISKKRLEANKLLILLGQLIAFVDPASAMAFGLFTPLDTKASYEKYVGDIMEKINEITARCGECD